MVRIIEDLADTSHNKRNELLRKDWERAKTNRDSANDDRKKAIELLKAAKESDDATGDISGLESRVKQTRRLHVKAIKEERRLFKELNAVGKESAEACAASEEEDVQNGNPVTRKRKRSVDQYLIYKERDDVFREWLNTVSTISLEPVDNLLVAVNKLFDSITYNNSTVEVPEYVIKNLDRSIELRQSESDRIDHSDEGHAYYIDVLRKCSRCLRDCLELLKERESDETSEQDTRVAKRRRLK